MDFFSKHKAETNYPTGILLKVTSEQNKILQKMRDQGINVSQFLRNKIDEWEEKCQKQ